MSEPLHSNEMRQSLVEELVAEYRRRRTAGEKVDRKAFLLRYPYVADALRVEFDNDSGGNYDRCKWDFGDNHDSDDCEKPHQRQAPPLQPLNHPRQHQSRPHQSLPTPRPLCQYPLIYSFYH